MDDDVRRPLGWVPVEGRGSMPFALVHGESLVAAASWALGEAGVDLLDAAVGFDQVRESGIPLVLHDPLCPLTPVRFLQEAVALSEVTGQVVAGYRRVTDTVKTLTGPVSGGLLGETVDREGLRLVTSPVVIPPAVLEQLEALPHDFAVIVESLAQGGHVTMLEAPALGARVGSEEDVRVLEALSRAAAPPA